MSIGDEDVGVTKLCYILYDREQRRPIICVANQRALPPSLLLLFNSKLAARKAVFGLFFKATKCVVIQAIRVFPYVSLSSECFSLFLLTIIKITDNTQLTVIWGKSTMVLSISSCTQFLMLKVALTLMLTVTLIAEIGAVLRGNVLYICPVKAKSYRLFCCFSVKK